MKKLLITLVMILAFLTGFLSCYAANSVYIDRESPFFISLVNSKNQPSNWISEKNIEVFQDKVVIYVKNPFLSRYADTGSMLPTLGENANGIRIKPNSAEEINVGDIITYKKDNILVVHRVVAKGNDELGTWFVTKGDNNTETDGRIYFKDIEYVTVALIY